MKRVMAFMSIGYPGCDREGLIEVSDDATEEEIDSEVREWVFDHLDWGWNYAQEVEHG